jgi:hypothetical protein
MNFGAPVLAFGDTDVEPISVYPALNVDAERERIAVGHDEVCTAVALGLVSHVDIEAVSLRELVFSDQPKNVRTMFASVVCACV